MVGSDSGGMNYLHVNMCYVETQAPNSVFPKEEAELASLQERGHTPHLRARQEDVQKDGNGLTGG